MFKIINETQLQAKPTEIQMATQIANMLNKYNKLTKFHTTETILKDKGLNLVYIYNNTVAGSTSVKKINNLYSLSYHTCVIEQYRKLNIAKTLLINAMINCDTQYLFGIVRSTNYKSINLCKSVGFLATHIIPKQAYSLIRLERKIK